MTRLPQGGVRTLLADLFFVRAGCARSPRRSLLYLAIVAMPLSWMAWQQSPRSIPFYPDNHLWASLNMALNGAFCDSPSRVSSEFDIARFLSSNHDVDHVPLRGVIAQVAGSVEGYCRTVTRPHVNNENSLMLQMRLWLSLDPGISLRSLGLLLLATKLAALLLFGYVLLECGASLLFCGLALWGSLGVLANLTSAYYSVYPFFFVLLLLAVSLYTLAIRHSLQARWVTSTLSALALGWVSAYGANMRTSHLPIYLAFFAMYAWAGSRSAPVISGGRLGRMRWLAATGTAFAVGFALFVCYLIGPLHAAPELRSQNKPTYHVVAHPLVLSLAMPPSPLSHREGIEWDDSHGLSLARRVAPGVEYLGAGYEEALFRYYMHLWRQFPLEMALIYGAKLKLAGRDMVSNLNGITWGRRCFLLVLLPLRLAPNGFWLLLAYGAVAAAALFSHVRTGSVLPFLVALLSLAACMLHLESVVIMPFFFPSLHNYLLFYGFLLCLGAFQVLVDGARVLVLRSAASRSATQ